MGINCVIGGLNRWVINKVKEDITITFEVSSKYKTGKRGVDFCNYNGDCI